MQRLTAAMVVTMLAGLVACGPLAAAEETRGKTAGRVASAVDGVLKLKVGADTLTFYVPKGKPMPVHEVAQLLPGDEVAAIWVLDGGRRFVLDVEGRGVVIGTVTNFGASWIEVTPPNAKPQRFIPQWVGGAPADGGGFDKAMLQRIREQKVGTRVALTWEMPEGKRVVGIDPAK